jgi:AraC family transcriptional regulator
MHCHENAHISFVLSGGSVEKRINREIERGPGKITFYHSEEYHQSSSLKDSSRYVDLELRPEFFAQYGIDETMVGSMISKNPDAKFLLLQICRELLMDDQWSADSIKMVLLQHCGLTIATNTNHIYSAEQITYIDRFSLKAPRRW